MAGANSSRSKVVIVVVALVAVLGAIWIFFPDPAKDAGGKNRGDATADSKGTQLPPPPAPSVPIELHGAANELSDLVAKAGLTPEERIQGVGQLLYTYRQGFGGNPPGLNEDVVTALLGVNEKHTALLPKTCAAIRDGQLVDDWGTPYWFHAISSKQMEVRSAGPDRELFTPDDLTLE
ncbi:hypothetical protein DES53_105352 [Roseimicrobium gellanilyticum]|uniref:Uncharacterized protein n=1 Tax=Roseimicrobium gellanilyticum TaxID=748857 RepID=A0A366HLZ9_9BACT|nr:hypothetical protein DES53_105352 [Roseimicrobium gellanilyticum]